MTGQESLFHQGTTTTHSYFGLPFAFLLGCSEDPLGDCFTPIDGVIMFAEPVTADGTYKVSVTLDDGTSGECSIELDGEHKNLSCSESSWTLLATSASSAAADDGIASGYESDITGVQGGETETAGGTIEVTLDESDLGSEDFTFEPEPVEEGCGTRPRADVVIAGSGAGGEGEGGSNKLTLPVVAPSMTYDWTAPSNARPCRLTVARL